MSIPFVASMVRFQQQSKNNSVKTKYAKARMSTDYSEHQPQFTNEELNDDHSGSRYYKLTGNGENASAISTSSSFTNPVTLSTTSSVKGTKDDEELKNSPDVSTSTGDSSADTLTSEQLLLSNLADDSSSFNRYKLVVEMRRQRHNRVCMTIVTLILFLVVVIGAIAGSIVGAVAATRGKQK